MDTYMPEHHFFPNPDTLRVSRAYYGDHIYDGDSLTMVLFDGGYISFNGNVLNPRYHFYVTDHLGSVRIVADANGKPEEQDGYYPYGMLDGSSMNYDYQPYKFCGKELDRMLTIDWLDHGARMYDPMVARWWRMDPLAEKNYDVTPYAMCNGDPINFVDNDGRKKHNWIKVDKSKENDKSRECIAFYQDRFVNDIVQIWAHGLRDGKGNPAIGIDVSVDYFYYQDGEYIHSVIPDVKKIKDAKTLYDYLNKYDKMWQNSNGGEPIIIMHCCSTSDFARKMSKNELFKDVIFVAPNATLVTSRYGNEIVRNKVIRYKNHTEKQQGHWDVFKNGTPILDKNGLPIIYKFNAQPGTYGFNYGF